MYLTHINGQEVLGVEILTFASGQKFLDIMKVMYLSLEEEIYSTYVSGQKVLDAEIAK